jgi:hypothetical protein
MIKWGDLLEGCPIFICSFKPPAFIGINAELNIKERYLSFKSRKKQEEVIMKQAVFIKSLTIALRQEVYDQIKAITDEKRVSMADWVREAVDTALLKFQQKEDDMNGQ